MELMEQPGSLFKSIGGDWRGGIGLVCVWGGHQFFSEKHF